MHYYRGVLVYAATGRPRYTQEFSTQVPNAKVYLQDRIIFYKTSRQS